MSTPNVLVIMTDEERYPPPYEAGEVAEFRRKHLVAREQLRSQGIELHRHYAASTACLPSRASFFTGHYPSLHGVCSTDGLAKTADDPSMSWLDPEGVPTMGDWFRAGGYRTYYRGKWHISHADLVAPGSWQGLATNDALGTVWPEAVELYRRADRLDRFGFSGWVGREPHGPDPADTGLVRDGIFAEQVCELFEQLRIDQDDRPWLAVASFVNPHDIAFSGAAWDFLGFPEIEGVVPDVPEAPSQGDGFEGRPSCHEEFRDVWPQLLYEQPTDPAYRRLYLWLHLLVDRAIERILDQLQASGFAENTIVLFTSDHGDLMGAHGGMQQKWHNAYDEAIRVPLVVAGPGLGPDGEGAGIEGASAGRGPGGIGVATSHVDILPTLLGLVGIDVPSAMEVVAQHHIETRELVGRDLSPLLRGAVGEDDIDRPVYFMTEDQVSRGLRQHNRFTGEPVLPVGGADKVESVIARLPTGPDGMSELWKLNHYYEVLADEDTGQLYTNSNLPFDAPAAFAEPQWELYNLSTDPEERQNAAASPGVPLAMLQSLLRDERRARRLLPLHQNPPATPPPAADKPSLSS